MGSVPSPGSWMEPGHEAGLVLSAQQGRVESYWELMQHCAPPLYRVAFALTRDRELAGLITQDALVQGWTNLKHFPVGRPFLPWLIRSVRALAVAERRRGAPGASAKALRGRAAVFNAAFSDLSIDDQMILTLSAVEHLSHGEIGLTLDMPAHRALSRLSAAREHLCARVAARQAGDT